MNHLFTLANLDLKLLSFYFLDLVGGRVYYGGGPLSYHYIAILSFFMALQGAYKALKGPYKAL